MDQCGTGRAEGEGGEVLGEALPDQLAGQGGGAGAGRGIADLDPQFHVKPPCILACPHLEGVGLPAGQRAGQGEELTAILRRLNAAAEILPMAMGQIALEQILDTGRFDFARASQLVGCATRTKCPPPVVRIAQPTHWLSP